MSGILKIMPISHQQSFLLARNFYNWSWATIRNPYQNLPSFVYNNIVKSIQALTVSEFKVRPITIKGAEKTIGTGIETLSAALIQWDYGDNKNAFYYPADRLPDTDLTTGLHEYYIKLSDDSEYISEPFWFIGTCDPATTAGDFSNATPNDDWNNDFWK